MEFFETMMGRQFYQSTMPSIAKSLQTIASCLKESNTQKKFFSVIFFGPLEQTSIPIGKKTESEMQTLFSSIEEARQVMVDDVIHSFNDSGWEDTLAATLDDIRNKNYSVEDSGKQIILYSGEMIPGENCILNWHIVELQA